MKFHALFAAMLLNGSIAFAQNDPVIMTINGHPVNRSEFENSYNKNNSGRALDKKSINEYVDLFVNYKLKIQAALDARLDTLSSFKSAYLQYHDLQNLPLSARNADVQVEAHKIYNEYRLHVAANGGMVKPAHILIRIGQKDSAAEQEKALMQVNSICQALKKGVDFATLAKRYSADYKSAQNGGVLPWIAKGETVKPFENTVFSMSVGEISEPVLSEFGYHVIKLLGKQDFLPYDDVKDEILRFVEQRNIRERLSEGHLVETSKTDISNSDKEDILIYEMTNRMVWDKASKDEKALAAYYSKNKKKYRWEQPRFKGIVYHVKNKADVTAVQHAVKGVPYEEWEEKLRAAFKADYETRMRVEKGIFKQGDNAFVDKMVFKRNVENQKNKEFPFDATCGKVLKKGPENYKDVKSLVIADFQEQLEKEWVANLRKKYKFVVNPSVLATVNKH